jgi:hypothetical protein
MSREWDSGRMVWNRLRIMNNLIAGEWTGERLEELVGASERHAGRTRENNAGRGEVVKEAGKEGE